MTEAEIKAECERLARLAWPWQADCEDPLSVRLGPDSRVWHPFEEDSCGIQLTHPERAPQALLAALRVLANEPDPRDAEIERLMAEVDAMTSRVVRHGADIKDLRDEYEAELERLRAGIRALSDEFARNQCDADEYYTCLWSVAAERLRKIAGSTQ